MLKAVRNANEYKHPNQKGWQVIRGYECTECRKDYVEVTKATAPIAKHNCPKCNTPLEGLIMGNIYGIVEHDPTTVGQLAERNTKKMGKYLVSEKDAQNKKEVDNGMRMYEKPSKELMKKLPKMNNRQKQRYIREGKL